MADAGDGAPDPATAPPDPAPAQPAPLDALAAEPALNDALSPPREFLLAQRTKAPSPGSWTLPGGKIEPGERALAAVRADVRAYVARLCSDSDIHISTNPQIRRSKGVCGVVGGRAEGVCGSAVGRANWCRGASTGTLWRSLGIAIKTFSAMTQPPTANRSPYRCTDDDYVLMFLDISRAHPHCEINRKIW